MSRLLLVPPWQRSASHPWYDSRSPRRAVTTAEPASYGRYQRAGWPGRRRTWPCVTSRVSELAMFACWSGYSSRISAHTSVVDRVAPRGNFSRIACIRCALLGSVSGRSRIPCQGNVDRAASQPLVGSLSARTAIAAESAEIDRRCSAGGWVAPQAAAVPVIGTRDSNLTSRA